MPSNFFISDTLAADELAGLNTDLSDGYFNIYSGTQPANANTPLSGNTLLASLRFGATAGSVSANVWTAGSIASVSAAASGTAVFFRWFKSDGTTALCDGSIGTSGCDLNLNTTAIGSGNTVQITGFTITLPEH